MKRALLIGSGMTIAEHGIVMSNLSMKKFIILRSSTLLLAALAIQNIPAQESADRTKAEGSDKSAIRRTCPQPAALESTQWQQETNCNPGEIQVTVHGAVRKPGRYCVKKEDCLKHVLDEYAGGMFAESATNKITTSRLYSQASPLMKQELERRRTLLPPQSEIEIRLGIERRYGIIDKWERIKWLPNYLRDHDTIFVPSTNDLYPTFPTIPTSSAK